MCLILFYKKLLRILLAQNLAIVHSPYKFDPPTSAGCFTVPTGENMDDNYVAAVAASAAAAAAVAAAWGGGRPRNAANRFEV